MAETAVSPWFTIEQLAERLQKTVEATYKLRHIGKAPRAVKIGKELRFHIDDIEAWERERREASV